MKSKFSPAVRFVAWLRDGGRGQSLTEFALIAPIMLILIGGIADLGRAFYYKVAVTNAAREAAHWATIADPNDATSTHPPSPSDSTIFNHVHQQSQESYGILLDLACPDSNRNAAPPLVPATAANPGTCTALQPGSSWLFIYPGEANRLTATSMLKPGQHWREVASTSRIVSAPAPDQGGVATVLKTLGGSLYPQDVQANSGCASWSNVSISANPVVASSGPPYTASLTVTVGTITNSNGNPNNANLNVTISAQNSNASFQQTWNSTLTATGNINIKGASSASDTVSLSRTTAPSGGTSPYSGYTVTVSDTGGCGQTAVPVNFSISIPAAPSPSPVPSPSAVGSPTPTVTVSPTGGAPAGAPNGARITCTVIYLFRPVTPLLFAFGSTIYIVGTSTLEATY